MTEPTRLPTADPPACKPCGLSCCLVAMLVLLRLSTGWHFFSEGAKKLHYDSGRHEWQIDFPIEGFLNGAVGPWAETFHDMAPSGHDWRTHLAVPKQMTPEAYAELTDWVGPYVSRRTSELDRGAAPTIEIPEFAPYAAWADQILADWRASLKRFTDVESLSEEQRTAAAALYDRFHSQLADYLAGESLEIEDYQNELWRLEETRANPAAAEAPFLQERVAEQTAETSRTPRPWLATVAEFDEQFTQELTQLATPEQNAAVITALENPEAPRLRRAKQLVTFATLSIGICLLLGLFTRLAAVGGVLFLLSVMATQPPWVSGANLMVFYYQLVEVAALGVLAAAGAGRWAGLDFLLSGLWSKCCGSKAKRA